MLSTISQHWQTIQVTLFPMLEEELGTTTPNHLKLITILDFVNPSVFIKTFKSYVGRPEEDRGALVSAFIAKATFNLPTTRALIDRLMCDPVLRRICGWERRSFIPSESTFSRAFAEFAESNLASRMNDVFIQLYHGDRVIGHISRDATAIEAREKAIYTPKEKPTPKKKGRPKKGEERPIKDPKRLELQLLMSIDQMLADLPKVCDIGTKKNSKGFKESWKGYKLHIDTADGDIPVSAILTSASVHDSQVALPLSELTQQKLPHCCYELMDAAYDAQIIRDYIAKKERVALIDFNHRSPNDQRSFDPAEAERYKERSAAERVNSQLKDSFGGRFVRVRGHAKVFSHLMFGILALSICQTVRLIT